MRTSVVSDDAIAVDVSCSSDALTVVLDDGRTVSVPLVWFPRLLSATEKQRREWEFIGGGIGIYWEEIDEDISVAKNPARRRRNEQHANQRTKDDRIDFAPRLWFRRRSQPSYAGRRPDQLLGNKSA